MAWITQLIRATHNYHYNHKTGKIVDKKSVYMVSKIRDNSDGNEETTVIKTQAHRIGRMIATARHNKGWSLRQLGNETGISHTWLRKLEHGVYLSPASDLLIRVADALNIDLERIDRIAEGVMSDSLPAARTYFRAKYNLSAAEIDQIERTMQDIQRNHKGGKPHDSNRNQN